MTSAHYAPAEPDPAKVEAFAGRMLDVLNSASIAGLASIGHQAGLFDVMAAMPPSSSEQIARAADLDERYVREWLAGLVAGGIIDYDPATLTYALPPERAALLTRDAGPDNLAFFAQYIALFGTVEQKLLECFRHGGGLTYADYPRFQALQREETAAIYDASLLERTIPSIGGLAEQLTAGVEVADIGCGSGHALNLLARAFPKSSFTGYDISEEAIAAARAEADQWGLTNATFVIQDVARLDLAASYDFIMAFDAIHDQVVPRTVLANIRRALRPGGTFLMVDFNVSSNLEEQGGHPLAPSIYLASFFHCMTVSLAHGGEGLGAMWGQQKALEYLAEAGFGNVEIKEVEGDMLNAYYICRT